MRAAGVLLLAIGQVQPSVPISASLRAGPAVPANCVVKHSGWNVAWWGADIDAINPALILIEAVAYLVYCFDHRFQTWFVYDFANAFDGRAHGLHRRIFIGGPDS